MFAKCSLCERQRTPSVLAIKYDKPLHIVQAAIEKLGGLEHLAQIKPWLLDFTRRTPISGYTR